MKKLVTFAKGWNIEITENTAAPLISADFNNSENYPLFLENNSLVTSYSDNPKIFLNLTSPIFF